MTCYRPLQALRLPVLDNPIRVIDRTTAIQLRGSSNLLKLPCGKCIGCKLAYSRNMAVRCVHESSLREYNSFVTLTYNDFYNERNAGSLQYRDFTLFMKRLRKAMGCCFSDYAFLSDSDRSLRFFMCGEYGSKSFRPHFHILFFNLDFSDKVLQSKRNGFSLYTSDTLSSFWTDPVTRESYGYAVVGSLTMESCAYVSRYCTKKALDGDRLVYFNKDTGEFLTPEKTNMSRRPGIAYEWFKRFSGDVYPDDKVVMPGGFICKPPRYYDQQLEKADPVLFDSIRQSRVDFATSPKMLANSSIDRLIVREMIQLKRMDLLPRIL